MAFPFGGIPTPIGNAGKIFLDTALAFRSAYGIDAPRTARIGNCRGAFSLNPCIGGKYPAVGTYYGGTKPIGLGKEGSLFRRCSRMKIQKDIGCFSP